MKRVDAKFVFDSDLMTNEISRVIYEDYLPAALVKGKYVAASEPQIVEKGLEYVQEALNVNKKSVSAKKVIVTL